MKKRNRIRQRGRKRMFAAKRQNRWGRGKLCNSDRIARAHRHAEYVSALVQAGIQGCG